MKAKRNCDIVKDQKKEIERLKHELGRYEDKVKRQDLEIQEWNRFAEETAKGFQELNAAVDDIVAKTAMRYGDEIHDDATGELLGYNLLLPRAKPEGVQKIQAKVWQEDDSQVLIGVTMLEEGKTDGTM